MQRISLDDRTVKYVEDPKDVLKYLPEGAPMNVEVKLGKRYLTYGNETYVIEKTTKNKGIYSGDICPVCEAGEMADQNGCAVCNNCNISLKCGL